MKRVTFENYEWLAERISKLEPSEFFLSFWDIFVSYFLILKIFLLFIFFFFVIIKIFSLSIPVSKIGFIFIFTIRSNS